MDDGDEPEKRSCMLVVRVLDEPKRKLERRAGENVIRLVSSRDDPEGEEVTGPSSE